MLITILTFAIVLSLLVLIHEFGHFLAAKKNGVKVDEFGLGIPPRLWGVRIGETLYSINLLPIGGFVKVLGEEEAELSHKQLSATDKERTFVSKKPHQKLIILTAGILMNILLAILIYYPLLAANNFKSEPVLLYDDYHFRFGTAQEAVIIAGTAANSPAQKAELTQGDIIETIQLGNGTTTAVSSAQQLVQTINAAGTTKLAVKTTNLFNGEAKLVHLTPYFDKSLQRNVIGVRLARGATLDYSQNRALSGITHSYNMAAYNINVIASLISTSFVKKTVAPLSSSISGPVGIYGAFSDIVSISGKKLIPNLLNFMAILSLSLATINILPFPALDGGRAAIVVYEWVRRKKVSPTIERRFNMAGFAILIGLIILITINDIAKLIR